MADAVDDAGEVVQITLHGPQRVVDGAGDFLRFLTLQPDPQAGTPDGYAFVREGGADVLLLATRGNVDAKFFERPNVAVHRACVATQDLGEILLGEQAALIPGLLAETANAVAAQHLCAVDLVIALAKQAEGDALHRAVLESDARSGLDLDASVEHLAVAQRSAAGRGEIDFADDIDDDLRLPRTHAGAGDNFVDHALVLGFGGQSAGLFRLAFLVSNLHGGGVFAVLLTNTP